MDGRAELDILRGWLDQDFPTFSDSIFPVCLSDSGSRPLCFDHPALALRCFPTLVLSEAQRNSLFAGYVYLSAFYFALDSTVDGHGRVTRANGEQYPSSIWLGCLLLLSKKRLADALPAVALQIDDRLTDALIEASNSLEEEIRFKRNPLEPQTVNEMRCAAGRASSVPLLFRLCASAAGSHVPELVENSLQRALYLMQLADDLGDWREDLRAQHYTSFLRECFEAIGSIADEDVVERFVYLEGIYERRLRMVIDGLTGVVAELDAFNEWHPLREYVIAQLKVARVGLSLFELEKTRG